MKNTTKKAAKPGRRGRRAAKGGDTGLNRTATAPAPAKAPASARVRKTDAVVALLRDGATCDAIMKATGWQAHSVRGFISGTLRKKQGLTVTKGEDGKYKIAE